METKLSPKLLEGLRRLWDAERELKPHEYDDRPTFPGVIGRAGTGLVRLGLAENLGRHIYFGNRPKMGENPDAWVKFKLTKAGIKMAQDIFDTKTVVEK